MIFWQETKEGRCPRGPQQYKERKMTAMLESVIVFGKTRIIRNYRFPQNIYTF